MKSILPGYYIVLSKVIQLIVGFASIRILTELLSPEELGEYYLVLAWVGLFGFLILNPIGQFFNRNINIWYNKGFVYEPFIFAVLLRVLGIVFISFCLIILFLTVNGSKNVLNGKTVFLIVALLTAGTLHSILAMLNILGERKLFFIGTLLYPLSSLVLSVVLTLFFVSDHVMWLMGQIVAQICLLVVFLFIFSDSFNFSVKLNSKFLTSLSIQELIVFSAPVSAVLFLQWVQTKSYRMFVENVFSIEQVGLISVSLAVSYSLFSALEGLMNQLVNPLFYKRIAGEGFRVSGVWDEAASIYFPVYFMLLFLLLLFADVIVFALVSDKYQNIVNFVRLGACVEFVRVISNVFSVASLGANNTKLLLIPYISSAIIFLLGMFWMSHTGNIFMVLVALFFSNLSLLFLLIIKLRNNIAFSYTRGKLILFARHLFPLYILAAIFKSQNIYLNAFCMFLLGSIGLYLLIMRTDLKKVLL